MSELHEPDLDRVFAALTSDLTTRSSGPGARAAVATARKRRRTRLGAIAVVVAAAVAGFVAPSLISGNQEGSVAGTRTLPAAAALSPESLTEATRGWTGAWDEANESNAGPLEVLNTSCLDRADLPEAKQQSAGYRIFVADGRSAAVASFIDYGNQPTAADGFASAITKTMSLCGARVTEFTYGTVTLTHGSVSGTSTQDVNELWLARIGNRVASLSVVGPTSLAPADTTTAVTGIFLAAVQDESSYVTTSEALSTARSDSTPGAGPSSFTGISLDQIHRSTGAWSKEWTEAGSSETTQLPCVPQSWPPSSPWGQSFTVGNRGTLSFSRTADAATEITGLLMTLGRCNSARWTAHDRAGAQGSAGWASYDGGSVFLAARGDTVASMQVHGLGTPSDEDATNLISLLEETLAKPSPATEPPTPAG